MSQNVYFDITIDGNPAGRITFKVKFIKIKIKTNRIECLFFSVAL